MTNAIVPLDYKVAKVVVTRTKHIVEYPQQGYKRGTRKATWQIDCDLVSHNIVNGF